MGLIAGLITGLVTLGVEIALSFVYAIPLASQ